MHKIVLHDDLAAYDYDHVYSFGQPDSVFATAWKRRQD